MKLITIIAVSEELKWHEMLDASPNCTDCKPSSQVFGYYVVVCECKAPMNWVFPHEVKDMLRLIREHKYPGDL